MIGTTATVNVTEFIVGEKYECLSVFYKLISTAVVGVTERDRDNLDRTDLKIPGTRILIAYLGFYIRVFDRKIRRSHDLGKNRFHKFTVKRAAVHPKFGVFGIERFEIRKAHDMIPMGVGEDKVKFTAIFLDQLIPETPDAGSCIDDDDVVTFGTDFDASGIPTVF